MSLYDITRTHMSEIKTKMFMGFRVQSEIRMYLKMSKTWKEEKITHSDQLIENRYLDEEYIGIYLNSKILSLKELKTEEAKLKQLMNKHFTSLNTDNLKTTIFSQVFVS